MMIVVGVLFPSLRGWGDAPTSAPIPKKLRLGTVTVDRDRRTITFPARVVKPGYMLEFLLCRTGTKEYESALATDALPHRIHAALLMLGLSPGLGAETVGETFRPPRGATVAIELHWKDKTGKVHIAPAGDWLADSGKGKNGDASRPGRWVFVGSERTTDGGYLADQEGGIIAVANVATAVLDVPVASTKSLPLRRYVLNTDACPPPGTKVNVLLRPDKNAHQAPYARALLEISPRGRLTIDGMDITMGGLSAWAEEFTRRHRNGRVVIRSAAEAPAGIAPRAKLELKLGGVYDFDYRVAPAVPPLLPRTEEQLAETMRQWREQFARPQQQGNDPGELVENTRKQIERRRRDLKQLDALWAQYAEFLRKQSRPRNKTTGGGK